MTKDSFVLAFTLANGLASLLITLCVALIGFTVTFVKDFRLNHWLSKLALAVVWLLLFGSIVYGLFNIKDLISSVLAAKNVDNGIPISDDSLHSASVQEYLFYAGLFVLIILGAVAFWSRRDEANGGAP